MKLKQLKNTGRDAKAARHVRLHHWLMDSAAWQSLGAVERSIYTEISRRYGGQGTNNGRIPYSVREAADALRIGKSTAARALAALEERGFIVATRKGHFDRKVKHASEWRLTEYVCDVSGEMPTKEFMRWQSVPATHSHKPVPVVGLVVPVVGPIGTRSGTATPENIRFGT
jgi:DNA-binding MarR family transcriptional regulator